MFVPAMPCIFVRYPDNIKYIPRGQMANRRRGRDACPGLPSFSLERYIAARIYILYVHNIIFISHSLSNFFFLLFPLHLAPAFMRKPEQMFRGPQCRSTNPGIYSVRGVIR